MQNKIKAIKVFILVLGTRGDLEPFLMLGCELRSRGHAVVFGSSEFHAEAIHKAQLPFITLGNSDRPHILSILDSLTATTNLRERTRQYYLRWLQPQLQQAKDQIAAVGAGADYFISNLKLSLNKNGNILPGAFVTYDPPASLQELTQYGSNQHRGRTLELVALNKELFDAKGLWGETFHFTGFWHSTVEAPWTPPESLLEFMAAGSPPVVVTMGSMTMFDTEKFSADTLKALELSGQRAIIISSWSGIGIQSSGSATTYCLEDAPYSWLFPRASCVIHHGGAGTVAAALRAGIPSIILPQILCQENFAEILMQKNLAAGSFDIRSMQPEQLAEAITKAVSNEDLKETAREWKCLTDTDSGTAAAADLIEKHWRGLQYS